MHSVAMIQAERRVNGTTTTETRYYISSLAGNAAQIANAVSHWSIENSLHWVLDVSFSEDASRIRTENAPQNFALLRQIALNLLTQEQTAKVGVKAKPKKVGWDDAYLCKVLAQSDAFALMVTKPHFLPS